MEYLPFLVVVGILIIVSVMCWHKRTDGFISTPISDDIIKVDPAEEDALGTGEGLWGQRRYTTVC